MTASARFSSTRFGALLFHRPLCSASATDGSCSLSTDILSLVLRSGRAHSASVLGIRLLTASRSCRPCIQNSFSQGSLNVSSPLNMNGPTGLVEPRWRCGPLSPMHKVITASTLRSPSHSPTGEAEASQSSVLLGCPAEGHTKPGAPSTPQHCGRKATEMSRPGILISSK